MVDRRGFLTGAAALAMTPVPRAAERQPEIAFTFDDPKTQAAGNLRWQEINERILAALTAHRLKSILFVCGMRVDSAAGRSLVAAWDRQHHLIGNHSYSHQNFDGTTLAAFQADMLRNEPLLTSYRGFVRLFRYPLFKEGNTVEKRDGMRAFLTQRAYRIGRATVDASDWAISARLERRVGADPNADLTSYRDFFLQHIWDRAQFYQSLAVRLLPRSVRHTVLLHHSPLNALFLDDLIALFKARGWRAVDADNAFADPIYDLQPHTLPAGESLLWALAKESGRFESELRYPGEDDRYEHPKMDALGL